VFRYFGYHFLHPIYTIARLGLAGTLLLSRGAIARFSSEALGAAVEDLQKYSGTLVSRSVIETIATEHRVPFQTIIETLDLNPEIGTSEIDAGAGTLAIRLQGDKLTKQSADLRLAIIGSHELPRNNMNEVPNFDINMIIQEGYLPDQLPVSGWRTPTVYAFVLNEVFYITPAWWQDSGRPCHACTMRTILAQRSPVAIRLTYLDVMTRVSHDEAPNLTSAEAALVIAHTSMYARQILSTLHETYHPTRFLWSFDLRSGAASRTLVASRPDCVCASPPELSNSFIAEYRQLTAFRQ
jgi:hypothetical protein